MNKALLALLLALAPIFPSPPQKDEVEEAIRLAIAKRYDEALNILHRQLARHPKDAQLNYLTGLCYLQQEELERAVRFLEASVAQQPQFPKPYLWLAIAYQSLKKPEQALQAASKGLARFPRNQPLLELKEELEGERRR